MVSRCVPGPINSCSISWRGAGVDNPQNRLVADLNRHPNGGITEVCTGDETGVAVNLRDGLTQVTAPANQPTTLAIDENGQLYAPLQARKRSRFPATATIIAGGANTVILDRNVTLDNSAGATAACWEICVDICDAWINNPRGNAPSVTIEDHQLTLDNDTHAVPAHTHQIPNVFIDLDDPNRDNNHDHGGDDTHDHGGDHVHNHGGPYVLTHGSPIAIDDPNANATMRLFIGNTACRFLSADRFFNTYSGRICSDIEVAAGQTAVVPITIDIGADANIADTFDVSSGSLIVTCAPVSCDDLC